MINPMSFMSAKQMEDLLAIQKVSNKIQAEIATSEDGLTLKLRTDDSEAAQIIPQIRELLVTGCANFLYQTFNISGKMI